MSDVLWSAIALYAFMSCVMLAVMWIDKRAATRGQARLPESRLHALELAGGIPGSLIGQQLFRHKRRKPSFYLVSWLILIAHIAGWIYLVTSGSTP